MKKRIIGTLLAFTLSFTLLAGCGQKAQAPETTVEETTSEVEETVSETVSETEEETVTETETEAEEETESYEVSEISPSKTMYAQKEVNVRKGPGTDYDVVTTFNINEEAVVDGETDNGWYRFLYNDEVVFSKASYYAEEKVSEEELARREAEKTALAEAATAAIEAEAAATPAADTANAVATPAQASGVVMIGDSRCVMMQAATGGGGVTWICENSKGYDWMVSNAIPRAETVIGKGTKVVICLGVNDVGNAPKYVAMINQKAAEWAARGAKTYYVSVNPVTENPWVNEELVVNFNNYVSSGLVGVKWIDTHSALVSTGYHLTDGIHFNGSDSVRIFNMIIGSL